MLIGQSQYSMVQYFVHSHPWQTSTLRPLISVTLTAFLTFVSHHKLAFSFHTNTMPTVSIIVKITSDTG